MMRVFLLVFYFTIYCQSCLFANNVKKEVRTGNKAYNRKDYAAAELNYRKALDSIPSALDAQYNLGCALYMQVDSTNVSSEVGKERLTNAEKYFNDSAEKFSDKGLKEASFFNLGNTYLKQGDLDKAIESYKKSLRINPNNFSTKENLYYAQLLKQQQPQNQDKNQDKKDDQDKNQDNKKDQQQNQNQDKNNKNDQNQDQQENQNEEQQNQQQQKPQNISKDDAERILNALQQQENQTQENLEKQKVKPMRANSGKNW